ncbi:metallophosphoesterase [Spirochaetota bacterium]
MKIIYVTDVHGAFDRVKELLDNTSADIYIISGDLIDIPFYNIDTVIKYDELHHTFESLKEKTDRDNISLEDFIFEILNSPEISPEIKNKVKKYELYTLRARRVMQQKYIALENVISSSVSKNIFCLPGNYDMDLKFTHLSKRNLHLNSYNINGLIIAGYGGADIIPSMIPEKYAIKYEVTDKEHTWDNEMYSFFEKSKPDIVITHEPAYGILDRIIGMGPSGSLSLRSYCDDHQVLACLTGHIHEDWGFVESEDTVYLNSSNFGEIIASSGDVMEGGTYFDIYIENSVIEKVVLNKLVQGKINKIAEYAMKSGKWEENIVDPNRYNAKRKNENYDTSVQKYSHIPEINLYNEIRDFFRTFKTDETDKRFLELDKAVKYIEDNVESIAMDIAGSVNMGMSQFNSDIDIVLYLQCNQICETPWEKCNHYNQAENILKNSLKDKYKYEIIDCIDLNLVKNSIINRDFECDSTQRFIAYRAMFTPINYKLIKEVEDLLNKDLEFKKEMEGSIRTYLKILATTSRHIYSFEKYNARLKALGIKLPDPIKKKIENYLQVKNLK